MTPKLIAVVGPTGVGKSAYAIELAQRYTTSIVSADSRQVYKGMAIGTDAPAIEVLKAIPHFFIACRDVWEHYSADEWAEDALNVVQELFKSGKKQVVMVGGSMMYLQAFLQGFDPIPLPTEEIRQKLWQRFSEEGVAPLREELKAIDPHYLTHIDPSNHKRIIRALEVYYTTGRPFSFFHTGNKQRSFDFDVEIHHISRPREELYQRINRRVLQMMERGLVDEVCALLPYRHLNALNTIGYKEIFMYLDGDITKEKAQELISKNSRVYARQQESFFRRWQGEKSPFPNFTIQL